MSMTHHAQLLFAHDIYTVDCTQFNHVDDFHDLTFEKFGVSDAQNLVKDAHIRPANGTSQTCIVRAEFVTLEAQNALLKIFEEPPASTRFLLIVPQDFIVLPTLLSRCVVVESKEVSLDNNIFREFLADTYSKRLLTIAQAQKDKDTQWQRHIKQGLISYLKTNTKQLKELEYAARWLLTRGASNKLLLEHIALTLPTSSNV